MAKYKDYDCVGCPQGCINCGRKNGYWVYVCDMCGEESSEEDFLMEVFDKELCMNCIDKLSGEDEE